MAKTKTNIGNKNCLWQALKGPSPPPKIFREREERNDFQPIIMVKIFYFFTGVNPSEMTTGAMHRDGDSEHC